MFSLTPTASPLMLVALLLFLSSAQGRESPTYIKPVPKHFGISLYLDSHNQTELSQLATHYLELECGFLGEVHVVSSSPLDQPTKKTVKKYFNSVHHSQDIRTNRFKPHPKSAAQIYLLLSKAVRMTCGEMEVGLRKYQQNVIVEGHFGPIVAYQASSSASTDNMTLSYVPSSNETYNFAVDAFFASKHHLQLFDIQLSGIKRVREVVKKSNRCEELALNFIVSHLYPELTTIKLEKVISSYQQQIDSSSTHMKISSSQSLCISQMAEALGRFPSRYLNTERESLYLRPDYALIANITDKKYQYYNSLLTSKQPPVKAKSDRNLSKTFGILTVTHTRKGHNQVFMDHLLHYATLECPSLTEINIIWNNDKSPKQLGVFKDENKWKKPVNFIQTSFNSIIHRFHLPQASKQLYQFSIDDDVRLSCQQMTELLDIGLKSVVGKVGLIPLTGWSTRRPLFQEGMFEYKFNVYQQWAYNLVITQAAILHRHHLQLFYINQPKINGIRKYVETVNNCEDIAVNFITNYFYPQLDTLANKTRPGKQVVGKNPYGGISFGGNHLQTRSKCINAFTRILGQFSPKEVLRKKAPPRSDADLVSEVVKAKVQYYDRILSRPYGRKRDCQREELKISQVSRQVIHYDFRILLSPQVVQPVVQEDHQIEKEEDSELAKKEEQSVANEEILKVKDDISKVKDEILKAKEENLLVKEAIMKVKDENSKLKEESSKVKEEVRKVKEESSKIQEENSKKKEAKYPELDLTKQSKQNQFKKEIEELREIISSKQQVVEGGVWQVNGWTYLSCALAVVIVLLGFRFCRYQRQKIEQSSKHKRVHEDESYSACNISEPQTTAVLS